MKAKNQFSKSLLDFLGRIPKVVVGGKKPEDNPPRIPLVIRVAAAGHLDIPFQASLQRVLSQVLVSIRKFADDNNTAYHQALFGKIDQLPSAEVRLVCQLASGLDQLAARTASQENIPLHIVLPGSRATFERSLEPSGSNGNGPNPTHEFRELIKISTTRVLELDFTGDDNTPRKFVDDDFQQGASVILANCDLLLIAIHDHAHATPGGTKWMEDEAERSNLPVIRIPIDQPSEARLSWTENGERKSTRLYDAANEKIPPAVFGRALSDTLIGDGVDGSVIQLGGLERRVAAQVDKARNSKFWDERWDTGKGHPPACHTLGAAPKNIDEGLKAAKVWADHRASVMAEIVRGSFIFCVLLGSIAIAGALTGLVFPAAAKWGKIAELVLLLVIIGFIHRSKGRHWRSQWLSLREVERCLDQAGWLALVGRTRAYSAPAHLKDTTIEPVANWSAAYLRAVLRATSFPGVAITPDYLKTAHTLFQTNLVRGQARYYARESVFNHHAEELLETTGKGLVYAAAGVTLLYLIVYIGGPMVDWQGWPPAQAVLSEAVKHKVSTWVTIVGVFFPALAAGLSAIRAHGEYAQISGRFHAVAVALGETDRELKRSGPMPSAKLAQAISRTTDVLLQEVLDWSAILRKKNIELS